MVYHRFFAAVVFTLATHITAIAAPQTTQQQKMQALSFMVGDWVGISKSVAETETSTVPAYQKIQFKVDSSILTIDLLSESLLIHTVIYYDEKAETYYYNPYYRTGAAKYRGEIKDGKFWVHASDTRRFIFQRLANGRLREQGEKLVDGTWQTYFEDTFTSL